MTDYMTIIFWLVSGVSLIGLLCNVKGSLLKSYVIWTPCNIALVVIHYYNGTYPMVMLFSAYTIVSILGVWEWRKRRAGG